VIPTGKIFDNILETSQVPESKLPSKSDHFRPALRISLNFWVHLLTQQQPV